MIINVTPAHRGGEMEIELQQVLRQDLGSRIDVSNNGRRICRPPRNIVNGRNRLPSDSAAALAGQFTRTKDRSIAHTRLQGKLRLEPKQIRFDDVSADHRRNSD